MKKLLIAFLVLLPFSALANVDSVTETVLQSVKGAKVRQVTLHPIPNSDSVKMIIETSVGKKSIILSKKHVVPALRALSKPKLNGVENVEFNSRYVSTYTKPPHNAEAYSATKVAARPNAAAMVTTRVMAANQQASK